MEPKEIVLSKLPIPTKLTVAVLNKYEAKTLADLLRLSPRDVLMLPGVGRKTVVRVGYMLKVAFGVDWALPTNWVCAACGQELPERIRDEDDPSEGI